MNVTDGIFLVSINSWMGHQLLHVRVKDALSDEIVYFGSLFEDAAEADVGTFEQGSSTGFLQVEECPHLLIKAAVRKGVGGELVFEEVVNDFFRVDDRIQHEDGASQRRLDKPPPVLTEENHFRPILATDSGSSIFQFFL